MSDDAPSLSLDDVLAAAPPPAPPSPAPAPAPVPRPQPAPTPDQPKATLDDVLALDQDQDRLKAATTVGLEQNPQRAARLIDLQARTGLPTSLIDQNLDAVEKAARQRDFDPDAFRRQSPIVAEWLSQDPARVGLTRDDLPRLAATEALIRTSPDYRYGPDGSIHEVLPGGDGYATVYRSPIELRNALVRRGLRADEATAEAERAQQSLRDAFGGFANVAAGAASHLGRFATAIGATGSDPAAYRAGLEATEAASVGLSPGLWGDLQRGAGGLAADLPLLLAGGPVAKAAQSVGTALSVGKTLAPLIGETGVAVAEKAALGAATMQPLAVRDALNDYQEHGAGHALTSWAIDSAIAGAFGPVGAGRFAARAAGVALPPMAAETSAAMLILRHAGLAAGQNEAFDLAHRIHDVASGTDPSALEWHNVLHGLALSGILGGVPGAVFAAPEAIEHARRIHDLAGMQRVNDMTAAVHGAETLRAIGDQVNETGAAALNQDAVQGLVETLARDSRYRTLYVDAQAWRDHFDGKDKPTGSTLTAANDAARAATGDPAAYDKALSSNGQIAIPLEKFVPLLADTAHRDWLTAEARLAPEAMNEREAKEHADVAAERAAIQAEQAGPGSRAADLAASADLVHEDIKRQQMAAGVSETVAERNAQIWRAAMHTASERGWTDQLPHEAYAQFKVRIGRALENAPTRDALDAMIERLKAGDIPTEADVEKAKSKMEGDTERQPTEDSARLEATRHGLLSLLEHFRAVGADLNEQTADLKAKAIAAAQDRGEALDQPAYHGSPHEFDRFTTRKIGSGEGQQAFGWGLYFAGKKEVAEFYRNKLSPTTFTFDGKPLTLETAHEGVRAKQLPDELLSIAGAIHSAHSIEGAQEFLDQAAHGDTKSAKSWKRIADFLREHRDRFNVESKGKVYTVEIPEDHALLDWDRPMADQPAAIQAAIAKLLPDYGKMRAKIAEGMKPGEAARWFGFNVAYGHMDTAGTAYQALADRLGPKGASQALAKEGVPGIKYLDQGSRVGEAATNNYVLFRGPDAKITGYEQAARGNFLPQRLSSAGESVIRLLKGADRSTFLHETGHFLLEFMHDLAGRDNAPESVKADLTGIREWLGAKDGEAITRDQHEQFARGFEKYLFAGKAPSTSLRGAFERFKRWLFEVYKSATALHVHVPDDVRAIFDRMLASDEEIAQARAEGAGDQPLFSDQAESGMNDQQWKVYLDRVQEGKDRARDLLEREIMAPLRAEETTAYQEQRAKTRLAVADQVNQSPTYRALLVLQRGAWPEGVEIPEGAERVKLDKADLVARYGDAALKMLPGPQVEGEAPKPNRGRRLYTDEGGIGLDEAAELFGFKDGGELWHTLVNAPDRAAEIERQTDEAMRAHHPDPLLDGTLHEKARIAIANDPRMEAMEREAAALALRAGRSATPSDLLKAIARAQIEKTLAKDLRPSLYRVAMNRAERAAAASVAKARAATDPVEKARATAEALDHRQNALLQTHLYREASKEAERVEKRRDYVAGWDKLDKREKIGKAGGWEWAVTYRDKAGQQQSEGFSSKDHGDDPEKANAAAIARARMIAGSDVVRTGYLEQADAIREAYDLKRVSNAQLQKREALRDFIARKEADDEPVNIPSEVVADLGRKNWKDLTIAQQQAVVDALKNLEHLANIKNRFLAADRKESFTESRDAQVATIVANSRGVKPEKAVGRGALDTPVDAVGRYFSAMATVSRLAREMDGLKDGGVMFETWLRRVNEANDRELGMRERSTEEMARLVKQWGKLTALGSAKLSYRAFDPEIGKSISHWGRIMVALNWGNADNRQRLMQSEGWSEGQVQRLMGKLDKADMRFVQGILDHIDSWWGDIKAKQERVYGVAPEKVEAVPIIHETGIYRGGYFPIAYDPRSMPKGRDIDVEQQAGLTRAGARLYASTKRGHAETRTGMAEGARVLLDPGVITRHLDNVTHDLAYHETLIDLNRLLRDKDLRQAMVTHWGVDAFRQFQSRLTDIAAGVQGTNTGMERMLEWARQGVNFANRAFNIGQALQQAAGLPQSLVRVGPKYFAAALGRMFRAPLGTDNVFRWVDQQSTMMRNRSKTFDKNVADNLVGVGLRGPIRKVIDGAGYYFWTKAFQVLDTHTWLASYLKAMDEHGGDEGKAKAIADQTVTDIQGSGATKDLPAIMRGGPLAQVFTSNMSWWLANYQNTVLAGRQIGRGLHTGSAADVLKGGADLFVLYGVQVAAWSALSAAISGTNRETWANVMDDPGELAKSLAKDAAYTGLSSMVLFRDLADSAVEGRQYRGPQGLKSMSLLASAIGAIRADGEDAAEAKAVAKAAGVVFHLPVASIVNLAEGISQAQQQGTNPLWPALFGPTRK